MLKALEGVTRVPPVCDRQALAWNIWQDIKYGAPQYRRFDDGKNALVGEFDTTWASADIPFFTEVGTFKTYYFGNTNSYENRLTSPGITTTPVNEVCPITLFHEGDNQRNIPKRICNDANASIQFVVPSGYKKFDFIYHTATQGDDNVTVTITSGSGKVLL